MAVTITDLTIGAVDEEFTHSGSGRFTTVIDRYSLSRDDA